MPATVIHSADLHSDDLSENEKEWLRLLFCEGIDAQDIARDFGTTSAQISAVRHSVQGLKYIDSLVFDRRNNLNLRAAELLLDRVNTAGATIPLEVLVKIYTASLPKAAPVGFTITLDALTKSAEEIADKYRLTPENRAVMIDFVKQQKKKEIEENARRSS